MSSGARDNLFAVNLSVPKMCEESLQELQATIQAFDNSFQFTWDAELTFMFASKYLKQAADKINEEKANLFRLQSQNIPALPDNNLKARVQQLEERENKVKSQENLINTEKIKLNLLQQEIEQEKYENTEEKKAIAANYQKLIEEKEKIQLQMQKLDEKYAEIKNLLSEIDNKSVPDTSLCSEKDLAMRYQDLDHQKSEFEKEKKSQLNNFLQIEAGLNERDENLEQKKHHLQLLAESLHKLKLELTSHHAKVSEEMSSQFILLQEQEKELDAKKQEMEATIEKLSEELKMVEKLKNSLKNQIPAESEILVDLNLQQKAEELQEREQRLKKTEQELQEKESKLQERAKFFDTTENLKNEMNKVQKLYQQMEEEYQTKEIALQVKIKEIEYREKAVLGMENSDVKVLNDLNEEIKNNLLKMNEDEQKLIKAQQFIINEKEELENSTKVLQGIFKELEVQRKKLIEDQMNFEVIREKFLNTVSEENL